MNSPAKTDESANGTAPCPSCGKSGELTGIGSASGRPHYRCRKCGPWVGKNPQAAAAGRLGGLARANALNEKEKSDIAQDAADKRWRDEKLSKNFKPGDS